MAPPIRGVSSKKIYETSGPPSRKVTVIDIRHQDGHDFSKSTSSLTDGDLKSCIEAAWDLKDLLGGENISKASFLTKEL